MTTVLKILNVKTYDSSPTLLMIDKSSHSTTTTGSSTSTTRGHILINCGGGTQRSFVEHAQKISNVSTVCLTRLSHDTVGGMPGMMLTVADVKSVQLKSSNQNDQDDNQADELSNRIPESQLYVLGPRGTQEYVHAMRHFVRRPQFRITVPNNIIDNGNTTRTRTRTADDDEPEIKRLRIIENSSERSASDSNPPPSSCPESFQDGGFTILSLPYTERCTQQQRVTELMSFYIFTQNQPGKFNVKKATEIGIPKGPLFGKLKAGESVTFTHPQTHENITVHPHQVVGLTIPGQAVLILQYPMDRMHAFLKSIDHHLRSKQQTEEQLQIVVHLGSKTVVTSQEAIEWRLALSQNDGSDPIQHIWIDTEPATKNAMVTPFRSATLGTVRRSMISPLFNTGTKIDDVAVQGSEISDLIEARPLMEYALFPLSRRGFLQGTDLIPVKEEIQAISMETEVHEAIKEAENILCTTNQTCGSSDSSSPASFLFTGTGSAIPSKHRNVTGMCLTGDSGTSILLDCGEGTIGNLLRCHHNPEKGFQLSSIVAVFISHPHADHHLDIVRLLEESTHRRDPLLVIAPRSIFSFLSEYSAIESTPNLAPYTEIHCDQVLQTNSGVDNVMADVLGFSCCRTFPVTHCPDSYAVMLDGTPFGRVVYSGDCRPSHSLAHLTKPVDLLVHESTFEDGMEIEAALKNHSTVGQAIQIGKEMEAKFVCLTHFSQRYPKMQPINKDQVGDIEVIFAFDNLNLKPDTLKTFASLVPALRKLYPDLEEGDNEEEENDARRIMNTPGTFARSELL